MGEKITAAKAMLHYYEEPAITDGTKPSGAVFFSGCNLKCVYCQNYDVSHEGLGKEIDVYRLSEIFKELEEKGASNIDLVTPAHFVPSIVEAFEIRRPGVPVVYNCGGYEEPETLRMIAPYVDFWLPDVKYFSDEYAIKYSSAPHYFETAVKALETMIETEKRIIVRHLVLPGLKDDSIKLLNALHERFGNDKFLLSLMSQYTPFGRAKEYKELNRRVTSYEYNKVLDEALRLGFDGFMQERTSAKEEYTPDFDLEGV
ncbi:MAG: radical SAM protein [Eubacteriales bacterium]|nr:radical SAM protein [Eubacteriales bacterium]